MSHDTPVTASGPDVIRLERTYCKTCGIEFIPTSYREKYCCNPCREDARIWPASLLHNPETSTPQPAKKQLREWKMATADRGRMREMQVVVYFMSREWQVFDAVSPAASCDLIVMKGSDMLRVQVKTAHKKKSGEWYGPNASHEEGRYDLLALVGADGCIEVRLPDGAPFDNAGDVSL